MTQEIINIGAAPNDGLGTPIRTAFGFCNDNFTELYNRAQTSPPASPVGTPGNQAGMYAYSNSWFYICIGNYDGSTQIWRRASISTW